MYDPMIERYQERLMKDPETYIKLLRRQNALHCVWHAELQEEIQRLTNVIETMAAVMEGYVDGESASAAKLHRYANQIRGAI